MNNILKQMISSWFIALLLNVSFLSHMIVHASQEPEGLPGNILFSVSTGERNSWDEPRFNMLARLDAKTLKVQSFYVDDQADILKPLSWSPQGDRLAFVRIILPNAGSIQANVELCILTLQGELQSCMAEKVSGVPFSVREIPDYEYYVTWSQDGLSIYFVSQNFVFDNDEKGVRRLIEADAATGQTIQTIYQFDYEIPMWPPNISWTPDLRYIAIGGSDPGRQGEPVKIVNLEADDIVTIETVNDSTNFLICHDFSPRGFLLAILEDRKSGESQAIALLDTSGTVVQTIDISIYEAVNITCPAWDIKGNSFYFRVRGEDAYLLSYSLATNTLSEILSGEEIDYVYILDSTKLMLMNSYLTFTYLDGLSGKHIGVVFPDGAIQSFTEPFQYAQYPIWEPLRETAK